MITIKSLLLSPVVRVSIALVLFNISVILIADMIGVIPNTNDILLDSRKKICESLAVQLSYAASESNHELIESTLENFSARNEDVTAVSMSQDNGIVVAEYGEFKLLNQMKYNARSTKNMVIVPVFAGDKRWGSVNVEFGTAGAKGILSTFNNSDYGFLIIIALLNFIGYQFILKRVLQVLDPRSVIPERVNAAFNTLAEGVVIVDDHERIVMANESFARKLDTQPDNLISINLSELKWKRSGANNAGVKYSLPWTHSINENVKQIGIAMNLSTPSEGVRKVSTNSSPILDGKGAVRGALVTFDDVTEVEETNILLESTVNRLQKNETMIRRKNLELEVLASRDSLTGCYNRRVFFDLMDQAYHDFVDTGSNLSCIMLDIDHFKKINDTYGHAVGDEAIRMVADILNACKRDGAIIGRYGGEEFCIALPDTGIHEAAAIAEEFRLSIKSTSKNFCAEGSVITVSSGVSSTCVSSGNSSQLLEYADQALYVAKSNGRDQVIKWDTTVNDQVGTTKTESVEPDKNISLPNAEDHDANDVTEIRYLRDKIDTLEEYLTDVNREKHIDSITQLPSRFIFEDRVTQAIEYSSRSDKLIAVAILDVDMFSRINDALGRVVGDKFLMAAGQRLKKILRSSDTVASLMSPGQSEPSITRLNNDEFAILLTGLDNINSLTHSIKRIQEQYSGKISVANNELYVTTTTGISVFPNDGDSAQELIDHARVAQKQAAGMTGRDNYQFYSPDINHKVVDQMQLEIDMHNAIENEGFSLFYQPKLDLHTNTLNSLEALIRWHHPVRGMVMPNDFIPVAEKTRMIIDIGEWALREACRQVRRWIDVGLPDDIRVSVNISAIEFAEENFTEMIFSILKEENVNPRNLEIELTETAVILDIKKSVQIIDELKFAGITIALDDFGTGYSSFEYMGALDFNWLKVDRAFINDALLNDKSRALYAGIVSMSREIGVKVVSEGIETQEQYDFVRELGVDEIQGYLLSKPLDQEAITEKLLIAHKRNVKERLILVKP